MTPEETVARLLEESPMPASAIAKLVGQMQGGKRVAGSTICRWMRRGHPLPDGRRVRLEHIRVGGKLLSTRAALMRFLAAQQPVQSAESAPIRSPNQRKKGAGKAMTELTEMGAI